MSHKGFSSPEKQREIASLGGKAAHAKGVAHKWTKGSAEARAAGLKGGLAHKAKMEARRAAQPKADEAWYQFSDTEWRARMQGLPYQILAVDGAWLLRVGHHLDLARSTDRLELERQAFQYAAKECAERFRKTPLAETNGAATREHLRIDDALEAGESASLAELQVSGE